MRYLSVILFFLIFVNQIHAQNPVSPPGVYLADPTARAWGDGKLYIYGSADESPLYYCSNRYHVLETADLKNWTLHQNTFVSKGKGDELPYSDSPLYAPDCMYRDGTYYLYYCLSDGGEGIATSKSPKGPFQKGEAMKGANGIDPAVFIDDDGQAYYFWGQFQAKGAKLKSNMKEIDETTITENLVTEKDHFFHEGTYMVKRNGIYYMVYSHMGRQDRPTCIGYSTSRSPLGPFEYGGVIIDNSGCDPETWNNHGSLVEFNNQWYVAYHRSTHNCNTMRKACLEPIYFREDGSIPEVPMTSQGAGKPLNAFEKIDAERACLLWGNTYIRRMSDQLDNEELSCIRNKDRAAWRYIDYGKGIKRFTARVRSQKGGVIDVAGDTPWSSSVGGLVVPPDSDWQTLSCDIKSMDGIHTLWLRFSGEDGEDLFDIDWFRFE